MQTFKQIVSSASKLLLAHPVGQQPHISGLWNKVEFQVNEQAQTENDAIANPSKDAISLYPALQKLDGPQADTTLLREFGKIIFRKAGDRNRIRWEKKLVLPSEKQIAAVQEKLDSQDFRAQNTTYRELVESFSTAMDRLVALNITNALLANGMPFSSSVGVKVKQWGPVSEYANGKKFHSIIPFTSAYAPRDVHADFGVAFAEMIINKMRAIREGSTARALTGLITEICEEAR
jgi:hypothetical protein